MVRGMAKAVRLKQGVRFDADETGAIVRCR